jgi:hypothetical protein
MAGSPVFTESASTLSRGKRGSPSESCVTAQRHIGNGTGRQDVRALIAEQLDTTRQA